MVLVEETPDLKSKHGQQNRLSLLHFHTTNVSSYTTTDETLFHGFECQASVGGDSVEQLTVFQQHISPRMIYGSIVIQNLYL